MSFNTGFGSTGFGEFGGVDSNAFSDNSNGFGGSFSGFGTDSSNGFGGSSNAFSANSASPAAPGSEPAANPFASAGAQGFSEFDAPAETSTNEAEDNFFGDSNETQGDNDASAEREQDTKPARTRTELNELFPAATLEGDQVVSLDQKDGTDDSVWEGQINITFADPNSQICSEISDFKQLNVNEKLIQGLSAMNYIKPSKIQALVLPYILSNTPVNIIAQSQTGTGKTGAFALGVLSKINPEEFYAQSLVLCPTRELAFQNFRVIVEMSKFTEIQTLLAIPDQDTLAYYFDNMEPVVHHLIVGTPGKVWSLIAKDLVKGDRFATVVLDEADALLEDLAMSGHTEKIAHRLHPQVQYLLFSATFNDNVLAFIDETIPNPIKFTYEMDSWTINNVKQYVVDTGSRDNRYNVLNFLFEKIHLGKIIIFTNYRHVAKELTQRLEADGHSVTCLYGSEQKFTATAGDRSIEQGVYTADEVENGFSGANTGFASNDGGFGGFGGDNSSSNGNTGFPGTDDGVAVSDVNEYHNSLPETEAGPVGSYMTQSERLDNLAKFKEGKTKILITTNLLSRGLDVRQINVVINYDTPLTKDRETDYETYIHRIGRTGRFGKLGIALNFVYDYASKNVYTDINEKFGKRFRSVDLDNEDQVKAMLTLTK